MGKKSEKYEGHGRERDVHWEREESKEAKWTAETDDGGGGAKWRKMNVLRAEESSSYTFDGVGKLFVRIILSE